MLLTVDAFGCLPRTIRVGAVFGAPDRNCTREVIADLDAAPS